MNCPSCGNTNYYFGLNGHSCVEQSCIHFDRNTTCKKTPFKFETEIKVPSLDFQIIEENSFAWSFDFVKKIIYTNKKHILNIQKIMFYSVEDIDVSLFFDGKQRSSCEKNDGWWVGAIINNHLVEFKIRPHHLNCVDVSIEMSYKDTAKKDKYLITTTQKANWSMRIYP